MALIGEIRKRYWLLVAVIGIALLLFILSDFSGRRSGRRETTLVKVGSDKIGIMEFNKRFDEELENYKRQTGNQNISALETNQLRQSLYNNMVEEMLLQKEYDELGINVSKEELKDLILGNNPHQFILQNFTNPSTGQFDKTLVSNFMQNLDNLDPETRAQYLMLESAIKRDRLNQKFNNLIGKSLYVPTPYVKRQYHESANANALVSGIRYMHIPDSLVTVTDKDYEKFYQENKYKYTLDADSRSIEYLVFTPELSDYDNKQLAEVAEDAYNQLSQAETNSNVASVVNSVSDIRYDSTWKKRGELLPEVDSMVFNAPVGKVFEPRIMGTDYKIFKVVDKQSRPDSLRASHILISYAGTQVQNITRTMTAAEKTSDSLLNVLKANPASFETVASTFNDDQSVISKAGDLGWFPEGAMVPEFNQAVLTGNEGSIVKVQTVFGYHIIKITGKKDFTPKVRVAEVSIALEPGAKSIEDAYNKASSFAATNNTLEKFETEAKKLNMRTQERLTLDDQTIQGLNSGREIVRWAFDDKNKIGSVSNVFDIDGNYVVVALKDKAEKGIQSLETVKSSITPLVMRDKKAEYLLEQIKKDLGDERNLEKIVQKFPDFTIDTVSVSFLSSNIPNYGFEPKVVSAIFNATPGQVSDPVVGEQAVYMFVLQNIQAVPEIENYDIQKRQTYAGYISRVTNSIRNVLKQNAQIKDNRLLFF